MNFLHKFSNHMSEKNDEASISLESINDLRNFGNQLLSFCTLEEIYGSLFDLINREISPQVVSVFLFSKDGYIERVGISGVDKFNQEITNKWLFENNKKEIYLPGKSFSGFAVSPKEGSVYGEPILSEELEQDFDLDYGKEYKIKLGFLKYGISVPLNGTHHTFGTIEVINKRNRKTGTPDQTIPLTQRDLCWLTIVGAHVSAAISRLRKFKEDSIITYLTHQLVQGNVSKDNVFEEVAKMLVKEQLMPYKVCILRLIQQDMFLPVAGSSATPDINLENKGFSSRNINEGMIGKVCQEKVPKEINKVKNHVDEFLSKKWIEDSNLGSFFCYPLLIQGNVVGVMSIFAGYELYLHDSDRRFLETIAYLLAAYRAGIRSTKFDNDHEIIVPFTVSRDVDKFSVSKLIKSSYDDIVLSYEEVVRSIERKYKARIESQEKQIKAYAEEIEYLDDQIIKLTKSEIKPNDFNLTSNHSDFL
jgi:GAF domain-containing protein